MKKVEVNLFDPSTDIIRRTEDERVVLFLLCCKNSLSLDGLKLDCFSGIPRKQIFQKIQDLKSSGTPFIQSTLADELQDKDIQEYIRSLGDYIPPGIKRGLTDTNYNTAKTNIINIYNILQLKLETSKALKLDNPVQEMKEIFNRYEIQEIDPIENHVIANHIDTLRDFVEKRRSGETWGIPIKSCPRLSAALMGIRETIVLMAEAKVGKSTLALQIASDIADTGAGVIYYDFENGKINLMIRQFCRKYSQPYFDVFNSKKELNFELLADYKYFAIVNDRTLSIDKIRSQVSNMKKATEQEKIFIVIDSLQKLPMKDLKERRAAIDRWLRDIEGLITNDPGLSVLMISEVSRENKLAKESGDIEYSGHFLLRLRKNKEKNSPKDPEPFDDMQRHIFIEYARDVAAGGPITYQADFSLWKFIESEEN